MMEKTIYSHDITFDPSNGRSNVMSYPAIITASGGSKDLEQWANAMQMRTQFPGKTDPRRTCVTRPPAPAGPDHSGPRFPTEAVLRIAPSAFTQPRPNPGCSLAR